MLSANKRAEDGTLVLCIDFLTDYCGTEKTSAIQLAAAVVHKRAEETRTFFAEYERFVPGDNLKITVIGRYPRGKPRRRVLHPESHTKTRRHFGYQRRLHLSKERHWIRVRCSGVPLRRSSFVLWKPEHRL